MTGRRSWATADRILAVRLDAMGDVLMTSPALRAIRESRPGAHVALLASPAGAAVADLLPCVDETIVYEAPWIKPIPEGGLDPATDRAFIERLAGHRFDAAVVFTVQSQSALPAALATYLAGIPLRLAHARENPYRLLTDWVPDPETEQPIRHEARRQLDLVSHVGYRTPDEHLSIRVRPDDARRARALVRDLGLSNDRGWLVVHPGASASSRRYPPERYAAALSTLAREDGLRVVLTGAADEVDLVESIQAELGDRATSLAGALTLGELAGLLALAPMLLANNTGPVHLAAAVGTPVVVVYAQTNLQHTPWQVPSRVVTHAVPCAGCRKSVCPLEHHACLRRIEPGEVVQAVRDLARETENWRPGGHRREMGREAPLIAERSVGPPVRPPGPPPPQETPPPAP